jgi:GNAT superfamily N-acetyltransferase
MSGVRTFKMPDLAHMLSMGNQMHEESIFNELDWKPQKLIELAEQSQKTKYIEGWVYETSDNEVIGMAAAWVNHHFFGDDLIAGDFFVYVIPEKRGTAAGVRLVQAYMRWAKDLGAKTIGLGVSAQINSERVGNLYRKMGFQDSYTIYRMMV